eukprot:scaffold264244_cov15-Tisochrysis_lutea.AAC.1
MQSISVRTLRGLCRDCFCCLRSEDGPLTASRKFVCMHCLPAVGQADTRTAEVRAESQQSLPSFLGDTSAAKQGRVQSMRSAGVKPRKMECGGTHHK